MAMMAAIGGIVSGVASMAGAAASASAQRQEAENMRKAGEYNEREHRFNAAIRQAQGAGKSEEEGIKGRQALARQRAGMAQSGLATDTGTPALLARDTTARTKFNQSVAMFEALSEQRAENARADLARWKGEAEATALENRAQATLLSGAAQMVNSVGSLGKAFG